MLGEWISPREHEEVVGNCNLLCDKLYQARELIAQIMPKSKIIEEIDKTLWKVGV